MNHSIGKMAGAVPWGMPRLLHAVGVGMALAFGAPAFAQDTFAGKPIRMVVSVGAGGATDTLTRIVGERLAKVLGTSVLVENQPGGSGVIAAQAVARAAPDGHTLLIGTNTTHAGNASFIKNLPYDPVNDFEPITRMGIAALVLSVNNSVPANTVQAFVAYARANPGKIGFGNGTGSARLASEMLKSKTGIDIFGVPYKSNVQALTDLRGGQIQMLFGDIALMLPHIRSGALKGLGVPLDLDAARDFNRFFYTLVETAANAAERPVVKPAAPAKP